MAAQYYLYCTTLNNTVICRSDSSFAPLPPNTGELYYNILIPQTQPLYLYRESGSTIIHNTQEYVDEYVEATEPPPTPDGNVTYGEFSGTTAALSAATTNLSSDKVSITGDTMTGSLSTTANFTAVGAVTGSTICGGVWVHTPIICATTRVQSPIISGSTCSIAPITIGTSCVCSPIILASTRICSPIILGSTSVSSPVLSASTCLCSVGTTRLIGATTAASTLNVSGATRLAGALTALSTLNVSGNTTLSATARSVTPVTTDCTTCIATTAFVRNYLNTLTGGSSTYLYTEKTTKECTTSASCIMYLSGTPWNFVAGRYTLDYTVFFGNAGTNGCTFVKFGVDDVAQGANMMMRMTSTSATLAATISRDVTLTAGCHCLTVHFWQGSGTACVDFASIRARRIY